MDFLQQAAQMASQHAGDSGDTDMFQNALSKAQNQPQDEGGIDEEHLVQAHKTFFGDGGDKPADSNNMGAAAAMQALKQFTGGQNAGEVQQEGGQSTFVAMAMSQAAKLFDQQSAQGNTGGASKQDAITSAAMMAFKMYQGSGGGGGGGLGGLGGLAMLAKMSGGGGGGLGGAASMLGMASKFM
jgi:hypothetical protein